MTQGDLSRLGRDYIEAGRLIQKTFPAYGVRFIAVNDNYDLLTADFNEEALVLPVKNFINDSYCRDISSKVKSHQKIKREKATINQILNNCVYIGYLICEQVDGKRVGGRSLKYSSGASKNLPLDEDIYKGLLVCGECGARFGRAAGLTGDGKTRNYQYVCSNRETIDSRKCENDRISLIMLNRLVLAAFEREFSLSSMRQKDLTAVSSQRADEEKKKVREEIQKAEERTADLKKKGSEDYLKFRTGGMTQEEFEDRNGKRTAESAALEESRRILSRRLKEIDAETEKRNRYLRMLMKGKEDTPLISEVLHALIEEIRVFPDKRVQIVFKFSGKELQALERMGGNE